MARVSTHIHYLNAAKKVFSAGLMVVSVSPRVAFAVDSADTQMLPMGLKVLAALAVVLGVMLLIYAGLKKSGLWMRGSKDSAIKLLEVRYLAPKKALYLIEVNGARLLLSGTPSRLEAVAQWPLSDQAADAGTASCPCFDEALQQQVAAHREQASP